MAYSSHVSFDKNIIENKAKPVKRESGLKMTKKRLDDDLEINEFFHARITQLDHFKSTITQIWTALKEKPDVEEQFKNSCSDQLVYGVQGLTWNIELVHNLLLRVMKIKEKDKEGSMYFKLCGEQFKFGKEEFALITRLKFDNCKAAKRKINVIETPTLFSKFFPDESPMEVRIDPIA